MKSNKFGTIQMLLRDNRYAEAVPLLQSACAASPESAELHYFLGCAQARLGNNVDAATTLQYGIDLAPNVAQSHFALAGVQLALGFPNKAADSLQNALKINNAMPDVHVELAKLQIANRDFIPARDHLEQALKLKPQMGDAYLALGRLEQEMENHEKAIVYLEKALQYGPGSAHALCSMGASLVGLARMVNRVSIEEAAPYYRKALDVEPGYPDAIGGLAIIHDFTGEYDKAAELIDPLIKKGVRHAAIALAFARICRHIGRCQEAVAYIDDVLNNPGLSASTRKCLLFAAGKVLDEMRDYDAAFRYYRAANDVAGVQYYDTVSHASSIEEIIRVFHVGKFMQLPRAKKVDTRPVFIVGMPRSGTSLTEQILASHPDVYGAGELITLGRMVANMPKQLKTSKDFPGCVDKLDQDIMDNLSECYLQELCAKAGNARRITDKMPHNFYFLGLIQQLLPGARVIHCRRDPMDTCLSIYFQDFNQLHDYARDLFRIGTHYHQYQQLMKHWEQVLSLPMMEITYEELVSDQESVTRRMLEFCELEWNESCMQFHRLGRNINTPSYEQVRQPIYSKSVGRWRHYEKFLDPLKKGLQRSF